MSRVLLLPGTCVRSVSFLPHCCTTILKREQPEEHKQVLHKSGTGRKSSIRFLPKFSFGSASFLPDLRNRRNTSSCRLEVKPTEQENLAAKTGTSGGKTKQNQRNLWRRNKRAWQQNRGNLWRRNQAKPAGGTSGGGTNGTRHCRTAAVWFRLGVRPVHGRGLPCFSCLSVFTACCDIAFTPIKMRGFSTTPN